ncbi:MAG: hypothetical protein HY924_13195 [Elusimicrobia bacterium]|nr:hypothetical protein [Elusimicrobiota bacterium]
MRKIALAAGMAGLLGALGAQGLGAQPQARDRQAWSKKVSGLSGLTKLLMTADREVQKQAAEAIRSTAKELKKVQDPYDLQGAMMELHMAMGMGSMGSSSASPLQEKREALLEGLVTKLESMLGPEQVKQVRAQEREGSAKGSLGAIRSALSIYYGDREGIYPSDPNQELTPKYLSSIPEIELAHHQASRKFRLVKEMKAGAELSSVIQDGGSWLYIADPKSKLFGMVVIDCSHRDSRGKEWYQY